MKRFQRTLTITIPLALLAVVFTLGGMWLAQANAATAVAQSDGDGATERVIEVSGHGSVEATPDTAVIRLGVQTEADTAVDALDQNNVRMQDVISATLDAGVAETNISTTGLSLRPVYERSEDGEAPTLVGYRASNIIEVTVVNLDDLGALLDAAVEAGSNTIEGIRFEVSDRADLIVAARDAAMNDAIAKAEQLTAVAGAELGDVLTIREVSSTDPVPVREETLAAADAAVPIQPGTQTIDVRVQVSWRIQ